MPKTRLELKSSAQIGTARHPVWHLLVAGLLYLAVALWSVRAVLPSLGTTFPYPVDAGPAKWQQVTAGDQRLTAWGITRNARTILSNPLKLFEGEQCYPLHASVTLGEHMFGDGLLGTLPYLLTGNPTLTYNIVAILSLWLGAMAMYALAYHWTASPGAAFVAGLLFGFHPGRLGNLVHLHVIHNQWTPLALLSADRLFRHRLWRDAFGLALFLCLQALGSFYPVLVLAIIGTIYGLHLVCRNAGAWRSLVPKVLTTLTITGLFSAAVFLPYLETKGLWQVLEGRKVMLANLSDFGFGHAAYPGSVLLLLAVSSLFTARRGGGSTSRQVPRLVFIVISLVLLWASIGVVTVPFTRIRIPSLYLMATSLIPGLTAVRAPATIRQGIYLILALLAASGLAGLMAKQGPMIRRIAVIACSLGALIELFCPTASRLTFGKSLAVKPLLARPQAGLVALYDSLPPGPVLDLPFTFKKVGFIPWMPHYVFLSAFHHRQVGACYNSFITDVQREIESIAQHLPDSRASDELYALGFRGIMLHRELLVTRADLVRLEHLPSRRTHLVKSGRVLFHAAFAIMGGKPMVASLRALRASSPDPRVQQVTAKEGSILFAFRNGTEMLYRHPDPISPTKVVMTWKTQNGATVRRDDAVLLLPLALAPGTQRVKPVPVTIPGSPGLYTVSLAPSDEPDLTLAIQKVKVVRGGGTRERRR